MTTRPAVTVLLGDPSLPDASKPGHRYNSEDFDAIARMKSALEGEAAFDLEFVDRHDGLPGRFMANPPEFVMNLCDVGFRNISRLELHVVALLEMLEIPYSGNNPAAITLCNDKALIHAAARDVGVPVPDQRFWASADAVDDFDLPYPVIVKPNRTHGSLGITKDAVVGNEAEALGACVRIAQGWRGKQPRRLAISIEKDLPWIVGDERLIRQTMINLLSNAFKFTDDDTGTISLRGFVSDKGSVVVEVADNGIGIPEDDIPHLTTAFYQVDGSLARNHDGTGLGLSLVDTFVGAHQGELNISSKVGVGTRISFELPAERICAAQTEHATGQRAVVFAS